MCTLKVEVWRPCADSAACAVFSSDVCRVCGSICVARKKNICSMEPCLSVHETVPFSAWNCALQCMEPCLAVPTQ